MPGPLPKSSSIAASAQASPSGKQHGAAQRRRLEVDFGDGDQEHDPDRGPGGEQLRRDRVANRIPQRAHRHQADAAEQHQRRQQQRIVVAPAPAPEQVRQPERGEECRDRDREPPGELADAADREPRLQDTMSCRDRTGTSIAPGRRGESRAKLHEPRVGADRPRPGPSLR